MEKEVKELLDEGLSNELDNVSRKSSRGTLLGVAAIAVTTALLFKFRNKIGSKIDKIMVKKLTNKGYAVHAPAELELISDELLEEIH